MFLCQAEGRTMDWKKGLGHLAEVAITHSVYEWAKPIVGVIILSTMAFVASFLHDFATGATTLEAFRAALAAATMFLLFVLAVWAVAFVVFRTWRGSVQTPNNSALVPVAATGSVRVAFGSVAASGLGTIANPGLAGLFKDIETLLGTWHTLLSNGWDVEWTFKDNGSVFSTKGSSHGQWSVRESEIRIDWDDLGDIHDPWETFQRPIEPCGTRGRSWMEGVTVLAKKLAC